MVTDPPAGTAALHAYEALPRPMDPGQAISGDPRLRALEEYVRALDPSIAAISARRRRSWVPSRRGTTSAEIFGGRRWHESSWLRSHTAALQAAAAIVTEHFPKSFLARRVGIEAMSDPIISGLTRSQREVLALLLEGLNARDIATRTGRAYNTVRVHIDRLREAFQASSIHALVVECHRRGIVFRSPNKAHERKDEAIRNCG